MKILKKIFRQSQAKRYAGCSRQRPAAPIPASPWQHLCKGPKLHPFKQRRAGKLWHNVMAVLNTSQITSDPSNCHKGKGNLTQKLKLNEKQHEIEKLHIFSTITKTQSQMESSIPNIPVFP